MQDLLFPFSSDQIQRPVYRKLTIILEGTHRFCTRFHAEIADSADRMKAAATAGQVNSVREGPAPYAQGLAPDSAQASLLELQEAYQDFLRGNGHPCWPPDGPEAAYVRKISSCPGGSEKTLCIYFQFQPARIVANILICLIRQALDSMERQDRFLEKPLQCLSDAH